jgi:excinuclease UvrABC nuclease subunit
MFGPFRSRASAERFESGVLELFQIRRCQEDLTPSPEHPGCMYGEMGMCLRPCQQVVGPEEYRSEVQRVVDFLESEGRSLIQPALAAREQFSAEMDFEEAARQHRRIERVDEVVKLRDEMARPVDRLNAIAVTPSAEPNAVELSFVRGGHWQGMLRLGFELVDGKPVSLDQKIRELIRGVGERVLATRQRQDYLAILSRWFYSSWRDGEFLMIDDFAQVPYRKLVHAVSRVHRSVV